MRRFTLSTFSLLAVLMGLALLAAFVPSRKPVLAIRLSHYESETREMWAVLQISNAGSGDAVYFGKVGPLPSLGRLSTIGEPRCKLFVATSNSVWRDASPFNDVGGFYRLRPGTSANVWIRMPDTNCMWQASMEYRPAAWFEGVPRFARRWLWRLPGGYGEGTMTETIWSQTFEYMAKE